ncbi:exopolyphosphatase domain protein [Mycobacteroides abscessus MAB_091912_2446]|uniref:Exopolyphosphatase domain protein n=1 Tax=Mycobacteroides abscessus MAB_091912_2446 TaxID=1335414 RepID=A0A829MDF9_9MYCO|nr:exopolyphosphatase domain protein [Mycobacteroides abscessus MAB_091912_2446]
MIPGAIAEVITGTEEAALSFAGAVGSWTWRRHPSWWSIWAAGPPKR